MAFEFNSLTEKQYLSDMTKEVNRVGDYLKNELTREEVETIASPDFEDILKYINVTGNYYVTTSKNQPKGEDWNGFVFFEKRNNNSYKIYFNPFNNENLYLRNYSNGELSDWQKFVLDEETNNWQKYKFTNEQGQYTTQEDVDIRELNNSKTIYVKNLVDPPKPELNEGWLNTKVHENGNTSITTFNPINSTTTYTKMQKRAREVQNPNLLRDSLFTKLPQNNTEETVDKYWSSQKIDASRGINFDTGIKFQGQKTVGISDANTYNHPLIRSNYLEVGKDVNVGDKVTFSAYVMIDGVDNMKGNWVYLQVVQYDSINLDTNSQIGSATTVNGTDATNIIKSGEWVKITNTQTVPSGVKYITGNLRGNLTRATQSNSWTAYFALPKLEKGDKATPFITHVDDKKQFDEIYTNWLENPDEQSILNNYTTDINNDNYFKYTFFKSEVGNMTLQDLLQTLPQGFHTFYAQGGIEGTPKGNSIRGTVQVDNDNGDIKESRKFINAQFIDYDGLNYNLYYDDNRFNEADTQEGWSPLRQSEQATYLWDGTLDLGEIGAKVKLSDSIHNYEFLDVTYYTLSAGHLATRRLRVFPDYSENYYIRDFNLINSSTGTGLDAFEGYFNVYNNNPKEAISGMSKNLSVTDKVVNSFNEKGNIEIKRITGINTL